MYYVTLNNSKTHEPLQITFDMIMAGVSVNDLGVKKDTKGTRTWRVESISDKLRDKVDIRLAIYKLQEFNQKYKDLIDTEDKSTLYHSFKIPKRSGGWRQIDAPNEKLSAALYDLKYIFENNLFASYHNCAYAYVTGRSTLQCRQKHQENRSRWFLKLDFSGFFPSTTLDFLSSCLSKVYPFCLIYEAGLEAVLLRALSLCFLKGGLPQGTPTSPMLTNLMMIPIDYEISRKCHSIKPYLCYTRYADDMEFSSRYDFDWREFQDDLITLLKSFDAPFQLNKKKTRYGSSAGRNWSLGLMLNNKNEITVGHERKNILKATLFQFAHSCVDADAIPWDISRAQKLSGILSYYTNIEPQNINKIIAQYNAKFSTPEKAFNIKKELANIIKGN